MKPEPNWLEVAAMTPVQYHAYCDQLQARTSRILYDGDLEYAAELKAAGWMDTGTAHAALHDDVVALASTREAGSPAWAPLPFADTGGQCAP